MLPRPKKNRIRMRRGLVRQRRHMQPAQRDIRTTRAIVIRQLIRAIRIGDVHLNDNELRRILEIEHLDMLILQRDLNVRIEIRGKRSEPQGRKERGLDRPPIRARGFREGGEDELGSFHWQVLYMVKCLAAMGLRPLAASLMAALLCAGLLWAALLWAALLWAGFSDGPPHPPSAISAAATRHQRSRQRAQRAKDHISICAPSSTTRFGGSRKKRAAVSALRIIDAKIFSRQDAMPLGFLVMMSVSRPRKYVVSMGGTGGPPSWAARSRSAGTSMSSMYP